MECQLFIDKYKPIYFNNYEIDEEIISTLKTLIDIDNLNILFIGSTGTGKTSLLNTLIKEYYKDYKSCIYEENILRINTLKEQGINYFRNDVKIFCQTCSNIKNKKKILVVDDIDLINDQSQQIFKNYIDKYSYNVHFLSSCSNIQKINDSLQSRLNMIKLKLLDNEDIKKIIKKIKVEENIKITNETEEFLLNISNGLIKNIINYMEKFKLINEEITIEKAQEICTNISFYTFDMYTDFIKNNNLKDAINFMYCIYDKGYSTIDILDNYFFYIKITKLLTEEEKYIIIPCICKYISIFYGMNEEFIELVFFTNEVIQHLNINKTI